MMKKSKKRKLDVESDGLVYNILISSTWRNHSSEKYELITHHSTYFYNIERGIFLY